MKMIIMNMINNDNVLIINVLWNIIINVNNMKIMILLINNEEMMIMK